MKQKLRLLSTLLLLAVASVGWAEDTYTYNFSQGGTFNSGDNPTCTWVTDFFTILQEKGESTNNVANYLTAPRWYQNHTVTITPVANCTITQIVINCNSTNNGQTISCSRGEITASGNNSTWVGSITNSSPLVLTMGKQCRPTSLVVTYSIDGPTISASDVTLEYDAEEGEIGYSIANQVDGVTLKATSDASWISNFQVFSNKVTFTTTQNNGDADRIGKIKLTYTGATDKEVTVTQKHSIRDYAELPFSWPGGASNDLLNLAGVTASGLGTDYAAQNAPYLVKFDTTGDYIQIKTDSQPGKVTVSVKMIGGGNTSKITVQGSNDGETFTDIQELTISGDQNTELILESANDFAATDRYVRLLFTRGSNVGVGPISIALPSTDPVITAENVSIEYNTTSGSIAYEIIHPVEGGIISATSDSEWLTFDEGTAYTVGQNDALTARTANVTLTYTYNTSSTVRKVITFTQTGNPNGAGSENNPYSVEQALKNIPGSGYSEEVYITGVVTAFYNDGENILSDNYHRYYISDENSDYQLLIFNGKGLNNQAFSQASDVLIGDLVTIKGQLTNYQGTKEVAKDNYIVSLTRPEKLKHQVSFYVNGEVSSTIEVSEEEAITFPEENPADIYDKTFVGWTANEFEGTQDEAPEMVTTATMGTADVAFYAVYATQEGEGGSTTATLTSDEIAEQFNSSAMTYAGDEKTYADVSGNITWSVKGYSTKDAPWIQLRKNATAAYLKIIAENNISNISFKISNTTNETGTSTSEITNHGAFTGSILLLEAPAGNASEADYGSTNSVEGYLASIVPTADVSELYVQVTAAARIWEVNVTFGAPATYTGYCTTVPVPEPVTVTITDAGLATFCSDKALDFTNSTTVYAYKAVISGTQVNLKKVTKVPAATGVLLRSMTGGDVTAAIPVATSADAIDDNAFVAVTETIESLATETTEDGVTYVNYILNKVNGVTDFYKAAGNKVGANKAYLRIDKATASKGISIGYADETDGIRTIGNEPQKVDGIYNLSGQRVNKAQKGIYIVNGKKVVIR